MASVWQRRKEILNRALSFVADAVLWFAVAFGTYILITC